MPDRIVKPDTGNDLVLQNDDASAKIEINEAGTIVHTGTSSIDVSGGTFTTSSAQKQAIVQAGPGSGTLDVSSGTLTTSTAQKQAIVDGATIEAQDLSSGSGTSLPNNVQDAITRLGTVTSGTFNGTIGASATFQNDSILQFQFGTYKSEASSTSSSYDDLAGSSFQVSITPSSSSNKILITCTAEVEVAANDCDVVMDFYRNIGGTEVHFLLSNDANGQGAGQFRGKETGDREVVTWCFVDSPSTTSQILYRPTLKRLSGSGLFYIGSGSTGTNTITAMEIKQ